MMDTMDRISGCPRWPVTLLTGMLGSGKTTLLRHALSETNMRGTVVLINELGEIGIDHHLVERVDGETILLRGGCLCCSIRADLPQTLNVLRHRWLRDGSFDMQRIIVETTGLAEPDHILDQIATNPLIKNDFPLSRVVVTVDAQHALRQIEHRPEARRQIAVADQIILTKTDIAPTDVASEVERRIRRVNAFAALARVIDGELKSQYWVGGTTIESWNGLHARPLKPHDEMTVGSAHHELNAIGTLSLYAETPLNWSDTEHSLGMLIAEFAPSLLRLKGILNVASCDRPMVIHGVHEAFYPVQFLDSWPDADRRSRLVLVIDGLEACRSRILHFAASVGVDWKCVTGHLGQSTSTPTGGN